MTFEQWAACGKALVRMERAIGWWIGDWWNAGKPYGDRVEQAREHLHVQLETVRDYGFVAKSIDSESRVPTLSFAHHRLVASFAPDEQDKWLERAAIGGWTIRDMRLELTRDRLYSRHESLTYAKAPRIGDRTFPLMYADPPWMFELDSDLGRMKCADMHYPCMTADDICNLMVDGRHVSEIADEHAALFLWCTSSNMVEMALPVLEVWRFKYKTHAVWDKQQTGTGYIFRNQHEVLIYASRGNVPEPLFKPPSVFSYPRGKHSAKPPEIRQALEKMYPTFGQDDRIELFARGKIPGWAVWGSEAVPDDAPTISSASNVAPVAPKLESAVKELFLSDARKRLKAHRMNRALKWRSEQHR
jgi:N6-adenosine-specific RNA methylase IME4